MDQPTDADYLNWNEANDHADGEPPDYDIPGEPENPPSKASLTLPQHNRPLTGTWCPWSDCSTRSGRCPDGCPDGVHPDAAPLPACHHGHPAGGDCVDCEVDRFEHAARRGSLKDLRRHLAEAREAIQSAAKPLRTLTADLYDIELVEGGHPLADDIRAELADADRALRNADRVVALREGMLGS